MGLFRGRCLQKSVFFIILFFIITLACLSLTLMTAGINDESKRSSLHLLNSLHIDSLSKNAQANDTNESEVEAVLELKTEPPTTLGPYDAEYEMRKNADYTREVCQSLTDEERKWFVDGSERAGASLTWTSITNRYSLLFTPIPKCGWTTWQVLFYTDANLLENIIRESRWAWDNHYRDVGLKKTVIQSAEYHKYKDRLLMVRNPYARLVSAYHDKALHADGLYSKRFSSPCTWQTLDSPFVLTFSQFVNCIIDRAERQVQDPSTIYSRKAGMWLDMHWRPQSHQSMPCRVDYNLIGKHNRFKENSQYMIDRLNLNAPLTRENQKTNEDLPLHYWYDMLTINQKRKLQIIYKYDFILFDFNPEPPGGFHSSKAEPTLKWFHV